MWYERGIGYVRELNQPNAVGVLSDDAPRHFNRQSSLARPSDADQGDQARAVQPGGDVDDLLLASDEAGQFGRQVVVTFAARWTGAAASAAAHRRDRCLEL